MKPRFDKSHCPPLGVGVGLRPPHYDHILTRLPKVDWFEAVSENFMGISESQPGRPLRVLTKIRSHYPVVLHGVSLSIGSADAIDFDYLKQLKNLIKETEPLWVSDHLCWTGIGSENVHDLLPLPYTEETLQIVSQKVERVQSYLSRPILLENVSSYLTYQHSEMPEWEFLSAIASRSGCGILLDINNVYVSAFNHGFNPVTFIEALSPGSIGQFHLAGFSDNGNHLIDTHDHPVSRPVWDLYVKALERFGPVPTLIEWDDAIPEFSRLEEEADRAKLLMETTLEKRSFFKRSANVAAMENYRSPSPVRG